jgi:hypothetical protein
MRGNAWLLIISGYIAFFFPSSISGQIEPSLQYIQSIIIAGLMLAQAKNNGFIESNLALILVFVTLAAFFTLLSPFDYVAAGGFGPYLLMMATLTTKINEMHMSVKPLILNILLINGVIFIMGFGIVGGNEIVIGLVESFYKAYDDNLFESMIVWYSKPVTVFATHSVAAIAYFCLFYLSHKISSFKQISKSMRFYFNLSKLLYIVLLLLLASNSSIILFAFSVLIIILSMMHELNGFLKILFGLTLVFFGGFLLYDFSGVFGLNLLDLIGKIFSYDAGGFLGRYASGGRLQSTYDYIIENPFRPIGMTYGGDLSLGDNFIAEYIIKYSLVGYLLILAMLYLWIRQNYRKVALILMIFIIATDLAYPLLTTVRLVGFMPLFILVWMHAR